jgi:hypothetical protein
MFQRFEEVTVMRPAPRLAQQRGDCVGLDETDLIQKLRRVTVLGSANGSVGSR